MKRSKFVAIILILSVGALGAYFIIRNSFSLLEANKKSDSNIQVSNSLSLDEGVFQPANNNLASLKNITGDLSQNLVNQISNQDLTSVNSIAKIDVNGLVQQAIQDSLKRINNDFAKTVNDSDLKISSDNSKSAKSEYVKNIQNITTKNFSGFFKTSVDVLTDVFQKNDLSSANRMMDIYKKMLADYYAVSVPSDWVNLHKKIILYLRNSGVVYQSLADYQNDPVRAYISVQMMDKLASDGIANQNELNQKIKEEGI